MADQMNLPDRVQTSVYIRSDVLDGIQNLANKFKRSRNQMIELILANALDEQAEEEKLILSELLDSKSD